VPSDNVYADSLHESWDCSLPTSLGGTKAYSFNNVFIPVLRLGQLLAAVDRTTSFCCFPAHNHWCYPFVWAYPQRLEWEPLFFYRVC
jgi:hypothetical protein